MYFAVDSVSVADITAKLVELIQTGPKANWTAVVDRAFDYDRDPYDYPGFPEALYACDELDALMEVSPLLIPLEVEEPEALRDRLWDLIEHCSGRPMLSFVASTKSAEELVPNWQKCARVITSDGQKLMLRFTDTRVLPGLQDILHMDSWAALTHELDAWWHVDRAGNLASVKPAEVDQPPRFPILVDKREFNRLLDWSEADAVIDAMSSDIRPATNKAALFNQITAVCKFAREKEIDSFPDVIALAEFDTQEEGRSLNNPKLLKLVAERAWKPGEMMAALRAHLTH